jgi:hypothetical protein
LVSARYPQPSRIMRTRGLGRDIKSALSSWLLAAGFRKLFARMNRDLDWAGRLLFHHRSNNSSAHCDRSFSRYFATAEMIALSVPSFSVLWFGTVT